MISILRWITINQSSVIKNSRLRDYRDRSQSLTEIHLPHHQQPDWQPLRSVPGNQIDDAALLAYLVLGHNEFHEQCVERIFCDIMLMHNLSVFAKYTAAGP